jgi:hypothetical protein
VVGAWLVLLVVVAMSQMGCSSYIKSILAKQQKAQEEKFAAIQNDEQASSFFHGTWRLATHIRVNIQSFGTNGEFYSRWKSVNDSSEFVFNGSYKVANDVLSVSLGEGLYGFYGYEQNSENVFTLINNYRTPPAIWVKISDDFLTGSSLDEYLTLKEGEGNTSTLTIDNVFNRLQLYRVGLGITIAANFSMDSFDGKSEYRFASGIIPAGEHTIGYTINLRHDGKGVKYNPITGQITYNFLQGKDYSIVLDLSPGDAMLLRDGSTGFSYRVVVVETDTL